MPFSSGIGDWIWNSKLLIVTGRLRASQRDHCFRSTLTDQSQGRSSDDATLLQDGQIRQTDAEASDRAHEWNVD